MIEELSCEESRITILQRPLLCHFCQHDIFIPYQTYNNVEEPGIDVYFVNYTAICQHCGCVTQFGDPSYFNADGVYIWAFEQFLINPPAPQPPVVRILDEATLQAQIRCLHIALQLLVQEERATEIVFILANKEQYKLIIETLIGPEYEENSEEMSAEKCLAIVLSKLTTYGILDHDDLYKIIVEESYPGIEPFLQKHMKE